MEADLLRTCEELLEILCAHPDHAKLQALVRDIEELRDRILNGEAPAAPAEPAS